MGCSKMISMSKVYRAISLKKILKICLIFCKKSSKIENPDVDGTKLIKKESKYIKNIQSHFFWAQTSPNLSKKPLGRFWDAFPMILQHFENHSEIMNFDGFSRKISILRWFDLFSSISNPWFHGKLIFLLPEKTCFFSDKKIFPSLTKKNWIDFVSK